MTDRQQFRVGLSAVAGFGLFAAEDIEKDRLIQGNIGHL